MTCGSKCKRLAMTRAVMEAKGALDQIREQSANLDSAQESLSQCSPVTSG